MSWRGGYTTTRANSGSASLPRSAFSLTVGERMVACVIAGGAWLAFSHAFRQLPPALLTFAFCSAVALSAIAAVRFVRNDTTRDISRFGYLAFAFPLLQTVLLVFALNTLTENTLLSCLFGGSFVAYFITTMIAFLAGIFDAKRIGDRLTLLVFIAWLALMPFFAALGTPIEAPR